jgi:hypothetical protein
MLIKTVTTMSFLKTPVTKTSRAAPHFAVNNNTFTQLTRMADDIRYASNNVHVVVYQDTIQVSNCSDVTYAMDVTNAAAAAVSRHVETLFETDYVVSVPLSTARGHIDVASVTRALEDLGYTCKGTSAFVKAEQDGVYLSVFLKMAKVTAKSEDVAMLHLNTLVSVVHATHTIHV